MELLPGENKQLQEILQEWKQHPEREMEASFGKNGSVDTTTFLNIIQRLKAKGYAALPQEDKLNIITPEQVRFSLMGLGTISQYCKDDILANKHFIAIIKDKAGQETRPLKLEEYDVLVKLCREIPLDSKKKDDPQVKELLAKWPQQRKAFRMIRRWTFEGQGIRFDLSMVRSTAKDTKGNYRWVRGFNDSKFLESPPSYEIEVELVHSEEAIETDLKNFIRGIGEVLRGIQKNTLLIRKSVKDKVLREYSSLTKMPGFRGVAPKTLQVKNMAVEREPNVPNIRDGYNVTDKADGLRVMGFCNEKGELFMIDMGMNVYRTGLKKEACANSLLDGEWVTKDSKGKAIQHLLFFDIYYGLGGKKVSQLPFIFQEADKRLEGRFGQMKKWIDTWNEGSGPLLTAAGLTAGSILQVSSKVFTFGDEKAIFTAAANTLDTARIYHTDGLIFTKNVISLPERSVTFDQQFKWKPSEENTIDFLVLSEKDTDNPRVDKISIGILPDTGQTVRYKTLRLFVLTRRTNVEKKDPRSIIMNELPLPDPSHQHAKGEARPILFNPSDYPDTMASVCYRVAELEEETGQEFIKCEKSGEPIQDKSIVEMRYEPGAEQGWRWVPIRVRYDKTERFQKGTLEKTMNNEFVANDNWKSIYEPVSLSMIRTGSAEPTEEELEELMKAKSTTYTKEGKYYDPNADKDDMLYVKGLQDFHNKRIKEQILLQKALLGDGVRGKKLVDLACGRAGDIHKWRRAGVDFVLGVDKVENCILEPTKGAFARLLNTWITNKKENVPTMVFTMGDSTKSIINGESGNTPEEQRIQRAIFGREETGGDVPAYVAKSCAGMLQDGADCVSCMFALHYFFETKDRFQGFLENVRHILKVGGYFVGCCFDGDTVFNRLVDVEKGGEIVGVEKDGTKIWSITKEYEADDLPVDDEGFGHAIDVKFISIGTSQREYLVPWRLLVEKMKLIGCELLEKEDLEEIGLLHSTNLFEESYKMVTQGYPMSDVVKEFSFLNRWFIFKRISEGHDVEAEDLPTSAAVAAAAASAEGKEDEGDESLAKENRGKQGQVRAVTLAKDAPQAATSGEKGPTVGRALAVASQKAAVAQTAAVAAAETAGQGQGQGVERTIGVEPSRMVPKEAVLEANKVYLPNQIFLFHHNAALQDKLKIKDKGAGRWLALNAPFIITDPKSPEDKYPSIEHYLAGMKYKYATVKPDLAKTIFSRNGLIHQKYVRRRITEKAGEKQLSEDKDYELLKEERAEVIEESKESAMNRQDARYDPSKWAVVKDGLLQNALEQRYANDSRFQTIVKAAREQNKYLLYYTTSANDLGGSVTANSKVEGENRVGKIIMGLAGYSV